MTLRDRMGAYAHWWRARWNPYGLVLWSVAVLHLVWGLGVLWAPAILSTTPLAPIALVCGGGRSLTVAMLCGASGLSLVLLVSRTSTRFDAYLGLPQQGLLFLSAYAGLSAALHGQYADGTPAPPAHIFFDQFPTMLIAGTHMVALLLFHRTRPTSSVPVCQQQWWYPYQV